MKNILLKIMPFVLVVFMVSCEDDSYKVPSDVKDGAKPVAAFTYTNAELDVQFSNTSTDDESYYWDFGDGTSSTEKSPQHTYATSGTYDVVLKVNSPAGYSSQVSRNLTIAGSVSAYFSSIPQKYREGGFGRIIDFDATASKNVERVIWDFGDGSAPIEGAVFTPVHEYADYGTYTVKVTAIGLLQDEDTYQAQITVVPDYEMIRGGSMEESDASFWSVKNVGTSTAYPVEFGYAGDKPSGGNGGCLRFVGRTASGGYARAVYQAIDVVKGEKYQLSAKVKWFANGFSNGVFFWCIAGPGDFEGDGVTPNFVDANLFISLFNNWAAAVPIPAFDNDLSGNHPDGTPYTTESGGGIGYSGPGSHRGSNSFGVYEATFTGRIYLGIELRNSWGSFFQSDFLVDEVSFKYIPE